MKPPPNSLRFDRDEALAAVTNAVSDDLDVLIAYVFGSLVRGTAGPLSDVDVAVLAAPGADVDAVCGRLRDRICRQMRSERVDVVLLTEAPVPVRYRIFREGTRVLCREPRLCARFITDTVMRYLDFQPVRERAFATMREAILRRP